MSVLTGREIEALGLVTGMPDPDAAYQPNGVDVSIESVEAFRGHGFLAPDVKRLPVSETVSPNEYGNLDLPPGAYLVRLTETIHLPNTVMAYLKPRSSLLRSGVTIHTAVWDAGYEGRGQVLLQVLNPWGFVIKPGSRVGQMVFHQLTNQTQGYSGSYQGEGLAEHVAVERKLQANPTPEDIATWLAERQAEMLSDDQTTRLEAATKVLDEFRAWKAENKTAPEAMEDWIVKNFAVRPMQLTTKDAKPEDPPDYYPFR